MRGVHSWLDVLNCKWSIWLLAKRMCQQYASLEFQIRSNLGKGNKFGGQMISIKARFSKYCQIYIPKFWKEWSRPKLTDVQTDTLLELQSMLNLS